WRFRAAGLLPRDEIEEIFPRYAQICAAYPRVDADMVSCHMDLKPENIVFDGLRPWLIDWMAASVNDRYFDLSIVANFVVTNEAEERTYLAEYFGQLPDQYQLARFFLMRQVLHMFYAAVFFRTFHDQVGAGEIDLADNANTIRRSFKNRLRPASASGRHAL